MRAAKRFTPPRAAADRARSAGLVPRGRTLLTETKRWRGFGAGAARPCSRERPADSRAARPPPRQNPGVRRPPSAVPETGLRSGTGGEEQPSPPGPARGTGLRAEVLHGPGVSRVRFCPQADRPPHIPMNRCVEQLSSLKYFCTKPSAGALREREGGPGSVRCGARSDLYSGIFQHCSWLLPAIFYRNMWMGRTR